MPPRSCSTRPAAAGAVRIGNTVSAAVGGHRVLAPAEARILVALGGGLLAIAAAAIWKPGLLAWPAAALLGWLGGALLAPAWRLGRERRPSDAVDRSGASVAEEPSPGKPPSVTAHREAAQGGDQHYVGHDGGPYTVDRTRA
jgi:hypothetical protein